VYCSIIAEFYQRHKRVICESEDEKTSPHTSHDPVYCFGVFDSRLLFGCVRLFSETTRCGGRYSRSQGVPGIIHILMLHKVTKLTPSDVLLYVVNYVPKIVLFVELVICYK